MIKIKNYTQEEIEYIFTNYNKMTTNDLAVKLNKSIGSISNAVRKMDLIKQQHKPWTSEEIDYLKNNYLKKTSEEIGKHLHRSVCSINSKRNMLGLIRNDAWTNNEIDYITNNFRSISHAKMGEFLNRSEQAVRTKCFEIGLFKKELPWTDDEINFVKNNYMEMKTSDISMILNRTMSAVELKASRLGLKKYPYTCNYNFFNEIDTEEKAYWLGFLTADGWINRNEKTNAGVTGVELQYSDIEHLKKFNKSLSGNYQITDRWRSCSLSKDNKKKHHLCCIRIFSLTMYNSLVKIGFSNNKSFDAHIPKIPQHLIRHFVRGYFDGNGCVCFTNTSFKINFTTASTVLCQDLIDILGDLFIKVYIYTHTSEFGTNIYRPTINKTDDKIKFLDWIYQDSTIYLNRKYKKYLKIKKHYKETQSLAS